MKTAISSTRHILTLAIVILATGCSVTASVKQPNASDTAHSISWTAQNTFDLKLGPSSNLHVQVNEVSTPILSNSSVEFSELMFVNWLSHDIPKGASFALYGWWAGSGEVLYALQNPGHLEIYWREEVEGEPSAEYELIKKISLE